MEGWAIRWRGKNICGRAAPAHRSPSGSRHCSPCQPMCRFSAPTVSIIAGVLTTTSTRRDVLVKVDGHGGGLDGGSGLELVHVISRPRCEHGLQQQRREGRSSHCSGQVSVKTRK